MNDGTKPLSQTEEPVRDATDRRKGSTRFTALLVFFVLMACGVSLGAWDIAGLRSADAGVGREERSLQIDVGDVVQVSGAGIGCIVTVRNGAKTLDCRLAGNLTRTYGTLLSKRDVRVVRFKSNKAGAVVFTARHRGTRMTTCHRTG
jgi:hypothetical protein